MLYEIERSDETHDMSEVVPEVPEDTHVEYAMMFMEVATVEREEFIWSPLVTTRSFDDEV